MTDGFFVKRRQFIFVLQFVSPLHYHHPLLEQATVIRRAAGPDYRMLNQLNELTCVSFTAIACLRNVWIRYGCHFPIHRAPRMLLLRRHPAYKVGILLLAASGFRAPAKYLNGYVTSSTSIFTNIPKTNVPPRPNQPSYVAINGMPRQLTTCQNPMWLMLNHPLWVEWLPWITNNIASLRLL